MTTKPLNPIAGDYYRTDGTIQRGGYDPNISWSPPLWWDAGSLFAFFTGRPYLKGWPEEAAREIDRQLER